MRTDGQTAFQLYIVDGLRIQESLIVRLDSYSETNISINIDCHNIIL